MSVDAVGPGPGTKLARLTMMLSLVVVASAGACSTGGFEPEPLTTAKGTVERTTRAPMATPESTGSPSARPTPRVIDVCAELPADRARAVLSLPASTKVERRRAGARCTYTWRPAHGDPVGVEVTAREDPGTVAPRTVLEEIVGEKAEPVSGIGDAAAMDRSGKYGFGSLMFAAVRRTDSGVLGVTVAGRATLGDEIYTRLAEELLGRL